MVAALVALSATASPTLVRPTPSKSKDLSSSLLREISDAARRASLDPKLVRAMVRVESNYKTTARSPKGAMGLMQVIDQTANESQIHAPYHSLNNLMGGCEYLRKLINRFQGDLTLALAAYNAGPSNVERYKGVPPFPETQAYVRKVLSIYKKLQSEE
jgi:soluble lytic murein transglycosylase-like protein